MKKYTLTFLLAASFLSASADRVELDRAKQMATQYASGSTVMRRSKASDQPLTLALHTSGCYVFNRGTDGGFIIVAADDNVSGGTILGFSDEGHFDADNMPAALKAWVDDINEQVAQAATQSVVTQVVKKHTAVEPLCTCTWSQGSPYNKLTPIVNGGKAPVGCVATTMVQIMYKYKYPEHGQGTVRHADETIDLAQQTYDWASMTDVVDANSTAAAVTAVSTLCRDAGYSINSNYGQTVTTAVEGSVPNALINNFGYSQSICDIHRSNFTAGGWDEVIYNELSNGRPVMLGGYNSEGGHNFLCDGYLDGQYHINWGWGGLSNGYFRMDNLAPSAQGIGGTSGSYNSNVEAIIGIQPATETVQYLDLVFSKADFAASQQTASVGDAVTFTGIFSQGTRAASLDFLLGIEVIDAQGGVTFLPATVKSTLASAVGGGFGPNGGNQGSALTSYEVMLNEFPTAEGTYQVRPAFQGSDGTWHEMYHSASVISDVIATVSGSTISLASATSAYELAATITAIDNVTPDSRATIKARTTFQGIRGSYEGDVSLAFYQNGTKLSNGTTTTVVVEEGETRTYNLSAKAPTYSGLTEVYVVDGKGNAISPASYIVVGGKSSPATIKLTKAIEMPATEGVNKYDITILATLTCESGNYVGPVKASVCGGKRYGTVMGMLTSSNYVIPEGKTVDIIVNGSIEDLADETKYKVYLLDSNGAYFDGQSTLDNIYFTTGKDMTPPEKEDEPQPGGGDEEDDDPSAPVYTGDYMLTTQWGQDAPYSNLCPSKYPTGCTATAVAQVMRYYKYPIKGTGNISYSDNGTTRTCDFSQSVYNWEAMTDKVKSSSPDSCKTAVAQLMKDVGYASQMQYASSESVAQLYTAGYGIATYFNYDKSASFLLRKMYSEEEWNQIIRDEIEAGRPVVYSGYTSNGGGHTFVVDGYKDGKFHINFGWDGMYDGYFALDAINPAGQGTGGSAGGYNLRQEALIGIQPYNGTADFRTILYNFADFTTEADSYFRSQNVKFMGEFANRSLEEKTFRYGVEFVDELGNSTFVESTKDNTRAPLTYYTNYQVQASLMPRMEGNYLVYPAYRDSNREWHRMPTDCDFRPAVVANVTSTNIRFSTDITAVRSLDIPAASVPTAIYTIDGKRVFNTNARGIYIVGGKKVVK